MDDAFFQKERRSQQFPIFRFAQDFASPESDNRKKYVAPGVLERR
jgi:hypothetical protein